MGKLKDALSRKYSYTIPDMFFISLAWILCGLALALTLLSFIPNLTNILTEFFKRSN